MSKGPIGVLARGYRETIDILIEKLITARMNYILLKKQYDELEKTITEEKIKLKEEGEPK